MPVWTIILGVAVFMYVLLDGFDLGIGILFPMARDDDARTLMMTSVAPVWDGNETWLVLGGLGLLAIFPLAFAIIMPAVYFPLLLMLLGLIFRGVAFEFRLKETAHRHWWDHAFFFGSAIATFSQGVVLGMYVQGFEVTGRAFSGTQLRLGAAVSARDRRGTAVRLHAARRNVGRDEDGRRSAGVGTRPRDDRAVWRARFHRDGEPVDAALARRDRKSLVQLAQRAVFQRGSHHHRRHRLGDVARIAARFRLLPFIGAMGLFAMCYLGLAISLFPYVVPYTYTLWQAAAAPTTQAFLLVGTLFLLPIIFMYIGWSYYVFRGKVTSHDGYH